MTDHCIGPAQFGSGRHSGRFDGQLGSEAGNKKPLHRRMRNQSTGISLPHCLPDFPDFLLLQLPMGEAEFLRSHQLQLYRTLETRGLSSSQRSRSGLKLALCPRRRRSHGHQAWGSAPGAGYRLGSMGKPNQRHLPDQSSILGAEDHRISAGSAADAWLGASLRKRHAEICRTDDRLRVAGRRP